MCGHAVRLRRGGGGWCGNASRNYSESWGNLATKGQDQKTKVPLSRTAVVEASPVHVLVASVMRQKKQTWWVEDYKKGITLHLLFLLSPSQHQSHSANTSSSQLPTPETFHLILPLQHSHGALCLIVAALIAPLALAVPTPGNGYGTGGSAPAGWDASVEDFCSTPVVLFCCNGESIAGAAGEPTSTQTGCINAMAGGQITYEFGYCPYDYKPFCCAATIAAGIASGCGIPTQEYEPTH